MTSTLSIASSSSSYCSATQGSPNASSTYIPPSPASISSSLSASSSKYSLSYDDEENITITGNHVVPKKPGNQQGQEDDLRLLAVSTHMTELSYAISDIQTRIFEIQELRHKSQSQSSSSSTDNNANSTTAIIDQSLMALDARLESVEKGMKHINATLEPLLRVSATPTVSENTGPSENAALLRKHAALQAEWEGVQDESEVLREELKEDKWLTVFRTVTDQADGMMSSLEKAVNRCQDFIWQVHRRGGGEDFQPSRVEKAPVTIETYNSLLDSFEAKKKHYMPATSKVLSIIDRGVRDRVTKNGETLRRHAESAQRWKSLRERIARTDSEMESVRKLLLSADAGSSETESSTSGNASAKAGYLATPPSGSRTTKGLNSSSISLSRSISPFRKFARKLTGNNRPSASPTAVTPLSVNKKSGKTPSSEPPPVSNTIRRQRTFLFSSTRGSEPPTPITPDRPTHKHSQSFTPESSPHVTKGDESTKTLLKSRSSLAKQPWNSSTKVQPEDKTGTIKGTPPRRPPSAAGLYRSQGGDIPPVPPLGTPYRRSLSRASMASSRPWSPLSSSISTTQSSHNPPPMPMPINLRPPSRTQTPSRAVTPGLSTTPRPRPKTPSHIPMPAKNMRSFSGGTRSEVNWNTHDDDDHSPTNGPRPAHLIRSFSPAFSVSAISTGGYGSPYHPPRPPSRSMIPVPSVQLSSSSRPGSAMSSYSRSESPTMRAFRISAMRAQTPESTLKSRVQQISLYNGNGNGVTPSRGGATRPSIGISTKLPPSSFKDGSNASSAANTNPGSSSRPPSRPNSRAGAFTPTHVLMDSNTHLPLHEYVIGNPKDPLDVEFANIVNSIAHGMLIERVDPPLKKIPKEGEEIKAQYAFSNALSRKVITCRLSTLTRVGKGVDGSPTMTKKVMCRVGGGWQDLSHYILNRQAGL